MNLLDDTLKPDLKIKGTTFVFGQANLIIKQKSWFRVKEIKKLPYKTIGSVVLKRPSSDNLFILRLLIAFIIALIFQDTPPISNKTHILFNYHVGEDKAVFRLDIRISDSEFKELKYTLKELSKTTS